MEARRTVESAIVTGSLAELDVPPPTEPEIQWEQPVPITAVAGLPAFPADIYPAWLKAEVTALAEFTQTPIDR